MAEAHPPDDGAVLDALTQTNALLQANNRIQEDSNQRLRVMYKRIRRIDTELHAVSGLLAETLEVLTAIRHDQ